MKTAARAASAGAPSASCQQGRARRAASDGAECAIGKTSNVVDGVHATTLKGNYEELFAGFQTLVDEYVEAKYRRH